MSCPGGLVRIDDTSLWVVSRGPADGYPIIVLHGGPGLDHHEFGEFLDPLTDRFRLLLVDQRSQGRSGSAPQGTWTIERMAQDVIMLARSLGLERYAVLGHSFGAFVALQNAVDYPGMASQTVVSGGIATMRDLEVVERNLATFEPPELRRQVTAAWDRETSAATREDVASLWRDQAPFHFADPLDPRIGPYLDATSGSIFAPDVLRAFASQGYGGIEVTDRLGDVTSPVLVIAGRHDRTCTVEAAERIVRGVPAAELLVLEHSGHMTFVEEQDAFLRAVGGFLERAAPA